MTPLYVELNRWLHLPFQWGVSDCIMVCADWVLRNRGVDPAADLRMAYGTAGECQRVTHFFSDPLAAIGPRMRDAGLLRSANPVPGDVAIVLQITPLGARPHGALCLGNTWAVKSEDGVTAFRPQKIIASWGVGYVHP